ncbi:hypothetical protein SOASR030_13750 [Leminorella grimontii]|uniref:Uncharacterized protein n=1 Tax=Leminorella grimontii TaxID=82981 RepID=A0AAV5N164_9GAMM|nr:hypothetical protein [Leminorella grimontii]GKX55263.1 hypothetical protein SOASR030_13750 [Leminorella grimontii]VFS56701.1 Uncharacterised protein [Leminorella grimontii]
MVTNLDLQGRWGLYPWFDGNDVDFICPDDVERARKLVLYGKVFYCEKQCGDFIVLIYGDCSLKVNPCLFKPVRDIRFSIGDKISVSPLLSSKEGVILNIEWHHKRDEPIYYLSFNGNKSSKRYFENELSLL